MDQIVAVVITGILSGGVAAIATVAALRVHVEYARENIKLLREAVDRLDGAIARAHARVDRLEELLR